MTVSDFAPELQFASVNMRVALSAVFTGVLLKTNEVIDVEILGKLEIATCNGFCSYCYSFFVVIAVFLI